MTFLIPAISYPTVSATATTYTRQDIYREVIKRDPKVRGVWRSHLCHYCRSLCFFVCFLRRKSISFKLKCCWILSYSQSEDQAEALESPVIIATVIPELTQVQRRVCTLWRRGYKKFFIVLDDENIAVEFEWGSVRALARVAIFCPANETATPPWCAPRDIIHICTVLFARGFRKEW